MSIEEFIDYLTDSYEAEISMQGMESRMMEASPEIEILGSFWKNAMSLYSGEMLKEAVSKKNAARIMYAFYKDVLHKSDVDWSRAKALKDIYECRVCANAIAQMYENGILEAKTAEVFGLSDILSDEELIASVKRMF